MSCSYCIHCPACGATNGDDIKDLEHERDALDAEVFMLKRQAEADRIVLGDMRAEVEAMRAVVQLADELVARGFKSDPFHPVPLRTRLADAIVTYRATTKEGA